MGGSIAVVCRRTDGSVHSLLRWTNPLPGFIHDIRFLNKDEDFMQAYIDQPPAWHEDEPDFSWPILPAEYGIVLLDWQNNKIISANHYTSFGFEHSFPFIFPGNILPSPEQEHRALFDSGKIVGVDSFRQDGTGFSAEGMSYDEFIEALDKLDREQSVAMLRILFDMSPFEVINLSSGENEFRQVRKLIEAEGIDVDPSWDQELAERYASC